MKLVLPEHDSAKTLTLEADFQSQIHDLIAPDAFPVEVAHALTKAERRSPRPKGPSTRETSDETWQAV